MQFCERESILLICVCYVGLCVCYDRKCWDNLPQAKPAFVLLLLDAASKFWKNGQSAVFLGQGAYAVLWLVAGFWCSLFWTENMQMAR
jgi:hypothetical protein